MTIRKTTALIFFFILVTGTIATGLIPVVDAGSSRAVRRRDTDTSGGKAIGFYSRILTTAGCGTELRGNVDPFSVLRTGGLAILFAVTVVLPLFAGAIAAVGTELCSYRQLCRTRTIWLRYGSRVHASESGAATGAWNDGAGFSCRSAGLTVFRAGALILIVSVTGTVATGSPPAAYACTSDRTDGWLTLASQQPIERLDAIILAAADRGADL